MKNCEEKILDERIAYEGKIFSVVERDIEIAPGKTVTWEVIQKQGTNSVAVVAVDDNDDVLLVEEYFGGINERGLNLPSGRIDDGETPESAANRELQEETGFKGNLSKLSELTVSPGYLSQRTTVFLARNLTPSVMQGDEEHHFRILKFPLPQALAMCESGEINEARAVAGLLLAAKRLM